MCVCVCVCALLHASYALLRVGISAHWFGFHDAQSGISHYEWRAGTSPGADDILKAVEVHGVEQARQSVSLPLNTLVYSTVRVFNKAGTNGCENLK